MSYLRNLSIRRKIIAINLSTCCLVLFVASVVFVGSATLIYRQAVIDELESIAKMIGYNSRAALVFNDREGADLILAALQSKPNITFAQVNRKAGAVLAQYYSGGSEERPLVSQNTDAHGHSELIHRAYEGLADYNLDLFGGFIDLYTPVRLDGEVIGTILIESDLEIIYSTLVTHIIIALIAIVFSSFIAFIYSSRLQKLVSQPILHLLDTMRTVSTGQNYSVRAEKKGEDELGSLTDGFNEMLSQIQTRVGELEAARNTLEQQGAELIRFTGALQTARDEAESANRSKSAFLAAMSHELRTPLNAIIGFSEVIKDETFGPVGSTRYCGYAKDIYASGQHLLALINDILDLSKVESGTEELYEEDIKVSELLQSALRLVKHRVERHGPKLELDIRGDLPLLHADERKLKQILVNLLANAIKFTDPAGKVVLRAWCRADSGLVIQVIDAGIGIAPADIPKALSRFGQVDSDLNRKHEGTGLGLPLSKALTEMHGGSLDLQSDVGIGTTVTVRLPVQRIRGESETECSTGKVEKIAS